ncbi:LysR family transcriptional regulator [Gallaecimonas mangrovi]|uniref:LysR family transcriptional regulator n=1 Tax=Gallaecimonas mangrovi TaxID=2291597 RepID=UPI001868C94C|nr:LysR family transcriptional regulator [Gallaecimonas mangrovi]
MFTTTLEQWALLKSVIDCGSIARAAEHNNRSQPAVSYQLNKLQERLGVTLLTLKGRKLELTAQGQLLLEQATLLMDSWQDLERQAASLKAGDRPFVNLVVDSIFPKAPLFAGLKRFHQQFPHTQVHVIESIKDEGMLQITEQNGDLYLVSLADNSKLEKTFVTSVPFVLVAHKDHPLMAVPSSLRPAHLTRYPLIQVVDKHTQLAGKQQSSWFFNAISSAIDAVLEQLGYGWLPAHAVAALLAEGTLQEVDALQFPPRLTSLYFVKSASARYDSTIAALTDTILASVVALSATSP